MAAGGGETGRVEIAGAMQYLVPLPVAVRHERVIDGQQNDQVGPEWISYRYCVKKTELP